MPDDAITAALDTNYLSSDHLLSARCLHSPNDDEGAILGTAVIAMNVARDKVMGFLKEFELEDKYNLYPAQLSGGQRQRCAIIQQILCSEHFLLMDEPFSGLDLIMLEKTCELINKVSDMDDLNTIIVVTHDVTAACSVADHLWLMGHGPGEDGKTLPGSRIVKQYNLIDRDLCWQPNIITTPRFTDCVREVKEEFRRL